MGRSKIDKTGMEGVNNFGSKMMIVSYVQWDDIDVYFPKYNWTAKNVAYSSFKKGNIKCPYEPRTHGKGYLGEGKYKTSKNGKATKCYKTWIDMLERCYSSKCHDKYPTYKRCTVCEEWLCFQNFAKWYHENYYNISNERMELDKDILYKGNKIYSPDTCVFVPQRINKLFVKCDKNRGSEIIGVSYNEKTNKYLAQCNIDGKILNLGRYSTPQEAFRVYKRYKEKIIKEVIDSYEGIIPEPHYSKLKKAMYNYRVEISD